MADQAAAVLRSRILNGELRPGAALLEVPLSTSLGVSRNTMREALRILSHEGLIRRDIHRGSSVAQLTAQDVTEIYQLRRMLELGAIAAVRPGHPEDDGILNGMQDALTGYVSALREKAWVRAVEFDFQFHSCLIRFHRNRRLAMLYETAIRELRLGMVLVDRKHDDPEGLAPVHRRMYELLVEGDLRTCAEMLEQHLGDSESRLQQIMASNSSTAGDETQAAV